MTDLRDMTAAEIFEQVDWGRAKVEDAAAELVNRLAAKDTEIARLNEEIRLRESSQIPVLPRAVADQLAAKDTEIARLEGVLERIAAPIRPDGTWNLGRTACMEIACAALSERGTR